MRSQPWFLAAPLALALCGQCLAAAECNGWGDFRGIRVDGQLIPIATSLRMATPGWKEFAFSATQMVNNPHWSRQGAIQTATGSIHFPDKRALSFRQTVEDISDDTVKVDIEATAQADLQLEGVYYFVNLPARIYAHGTAQLADSATQVSLTGGGKPEYLSGKSNRVRVASDSQWIEVAFEQALDVVVKKDRFIDTDIIVQPGLRLPHDPAGDDLVAVYFPLGTGSLKQGQSVHRTFTIKAGGAIDKSPVNLTLDPSHSGAAFDGIGGNFRIQSPFDAPAVQYNLDHLRVPWARVAMPLDAWQPREIADPTTQPANRQRASMFQQMEMARTLAQQGIPLIITVWSVPQWALLPPGPQPAEWLGRIPARIVRPEKWDAVDAAVISYLQYLKKNYGVEPRLWSLNECDLGINVLTTPREHAELMARLGAKLAAAGLKTRMLLADACSPHPVKFIDAAMHDPQAIKYIGGVSYHSWHDGTNEEFAAWGRAARELNVPLFIGEGGTDSDAHQYPAIFEEPWFAMYEVDTYIRICAYSQPRSILHWQLTSNYSILTGGGRSGQPLQPGRRFWNFKQINLTPAGALALPIGADRSTISAAAFASGDEVVIHLVNNGATRTATIGGLPARVKRLQLYVTDATHGMSLMSAVPVSDGRAVVSLAAQSLATLSSIR